jgi:formylglycine-generating enzyme required for sulfatase activity
MVALRREAGSPSDEGIAKDTALAKVVTLPPGFAIDRTEVTRQQYATWLMTDPPTKGQPSWCAWNVDYTPRCEWPPGKKGNHPVVCVDWCDAFAYCRAVGKRLCGAMGGGAVASADVDNAQKGQWYAACSAGGGLPFPYGDSYESEICNGQDKTVTGCHHGSCTTAEVGASGDCQSSGNYAGVYDLSGNVAEFEDSCDGTIGADDSCRIRGGSFLASGGKLRCKAQDTFQRSQSHNHVGFRCCSDP